MAHHGGSKEVTADARDSHSRSAATATATRTSNNSVTRAWSLAPGTGSCTEADPGRSATWTGRSSTTGRHQLPLFAAESTADEAPLHPPTPWPELNKARFICWLCTSLPGDEVPLRFRPWETAREPGVVEEGSVTITVREIYDY
jgi:hypothetical protein